jgi:glucose/mannose-6-phosphate isomerase
MNLDDLTALRKIDQSGMLSVMERAPERLAPPADAAATCSKRMNRPLNVVFGGVGGSGIVGEILTDYSRAAVDAPVSVCRSVQVPRFVGKGTLFVAVSYSGETEETLTLLDQAKQKGAEVVTIASGGRLNAQSRQQGIPYLKVPEGILPRVALPELLAAAVFVLESAELLRDSEKILGRSAGLLKTQIASISQTAPLQRNKAKQMAHALADKLPLLIGNEENTSVLRRFKNELNENSKMPAFYYTLPEGYHDDVEGLKALNQLSRTQPILLRSQEGLEGQRRTREKLYALLAELGFPTVLEFEGMGGDRLGQLLTAVTFGDFVSVYLAALRGLDPSKLELIPRFREAMRGA